MQGEKQTATSHSTASDGERGPLGEKNKIKKEGKKIKMGSSSKEDTASDGDTSSRETPPPDSSLFSEGERVLAYHGPCVYEAKAFLLSNLFSFNFPLPFNFQNESHFLTFLSCCFINSLIIPFFFLKTSCFD